MTGSWFGQVTRRSALAAAVLAAGCLSRWSGCRSYDTGHLAGAGWTARVSCDPHTEVGFGGLHGCTARWRFAVERGRATETVPLTGPRRPSPDCGVVRQYCASAHGELAQRVTPTGTWVAARAPEGPTRVAFIPPTCGATYVLPEDAAPTLAPAAAVARQPEGAAFLDGVVAHERITSDAWWLLCDHELLSRLAAVRAAMLACRVPDRVARDLFRADPASVEAAWSAMVGGRLPCARSIRLTLRESAAQALGELALHQLATCETRCPPRGRVEALIEVGEQRLAGGRDVADRIASAGPPPSLAADADEAARTRHGDASDEWFAAQWALSRVDPQRGTEVGLATLRRLPAREGVGRLPSSHQGLPEADHDDPATALCSILLGDPTRSREGLWQIASDESLGDGVRQHALLALARMGDPRASGATLGRNPLTAEQGALVRGSDGTSGSGHSGGHHHHHWP